MNQQDIADIIEAGAVDPIQWAKVFFPHLFEGPIRPYARATFAVLLGRPDILTKYGDLDWIRREFVVRLVDDEGNETGKNIPVFQWNAEKTALEFSENVKADNILLMLPRGFSKTTWTYVSIIYNVIYELVRCILYISSSGTHAETQITNIKHEFESNEMLRAVYGECVPTKGDGTKWTENMIEVRKPHQKVGVAIYARGRGAQIRGVLFRGNRPDYIVADDVEDEESVETQGQRDKCSLWFHKTVLPAVSSKMASRVVVLGTLLSKECLLQILRRDPDWTAIVMSAVDSKKKPIWIDLFPLEKLEKIKKSWILRGQLSSFYLEYYNVFRADEMAKFRREYIRVNPIKIQDTIARAIVIDPAISKKSEADLCAFALVGMMESGLLHVYEAFGKRGMAFKEQADTYFSLFAEYRPQHCGIESIAYQAALIQYMQEHMARKNLFFNITPITHSKKKEERIEGTLQPRYANGWITHQRNFHQYEAHMLDYPHDKKDILDAVSMACGLLMPDHVHHALEHPMTEPLAPLESTGAGDGMEIGI